MNPYYEKYMKYKKNYLAMKGVTSPIVYTENLSIEPVSQKADKGGNLKNSTDRMKYYASYKEEYLSQSHDKD